MYTKIFNNSTKILSTTTTTKVRDESNGWSWSWSILPKRLCFEREGAVLGCWKEALKLVISIVIIIFLQNYPYRNTYANFQQARNRNFAPRNLKTLHCDQQQATTKTQDCAFENNFSFEILIIVDHFQQYWLVNCQKLQTIP